MKPTITFVGHASVIIDTGDAVIWTDPWLVSDVFNEGWRLHPQPVLAESDRNRITHVWISHEHPDHLNIPTLKSLDDEWLSSRTLLYQRHYSDDVVTYLRTVGFAGVVELEHGRPRRITDGVEVVSHQVGHEDSSMTFRGQDWTILNLNDCKPTDRALAKIIGNRRIDVLLDQFSVAGWNGNPKDLETKAEHAAAALAEFKTHVRVVDPKRIIPFASFVRFSHVESNHVNAGINRIDEVAASVAPPRLTVMYPGDSWRIDEPFARTASAIARYRHDYADLGGLPRTSHDPVALDKVLSAAGDTVGQIRKHFPRAILKRIPAIDFALTDAAATIRVDLSSGAELVTDPAATCTVHLSSQAAWYTFAHRWGIPTLLISGRFSLSGNKRSFERFKQLGAAYASGYHGKGLLSGLAKARRRQFFVRRIPDLYDQFLPRARRALSRDRD
jgi:UDP-MurNAc hydroxylase